MERLHGIVELRNEEMETAEGGDICEIGIFIDDDGDGVPDRLIIILFEC